MFNVINNSWASAPAEMFNSEPPLRANRRRSRTLASRNGKPGTLSSPARAGAGTQAAGSALEAKQGTTWAIPTHRIPKSIPSRYYCIPAPSAESRRSDSTPRAPEFSSYEFGSAHSHPSNLSQNQDPVKDNGHFCDPRVKLGMM